MSDLAVYSARSVFEGMKRKLIQYLEAQYHIWDEGLIAGRRELFETEGVIFQEPRLETTPFYAPGRPYDQLEIPQAGKEILTTASSHNETGIPRIPYQHQATAIELAVGQGREVIVATGTGSGKTESFLMPILASLAIEANSRQESWRKPGCRALLLYPMNALVNDQIARLRRLLGQPDVAERLRRGRDRRASFGMYTSRTPYPGERDQRKDDARLGALIQKSYLDLPESVQELLDQEGKWPAKDLSRFLSSEYSTGPEDTEMFSRQEMHEHCPDILVTNYSMLEYMLLRPIENPIFEQTRDWLAFDSRNIFTIVLDEAHMYKGAQGAEVAYLLRRLHTRLGVPRERVRYILTSASLGSTAVAHERMRKFAADLSGLEAHNREFELITGEVQKKSGPRLASRPEADALASYDFSSLHNLDIDLAGSIDKFKTLATATGGSLRSVIDDVTLFQDAVFDWLQKFPPAAQLANEITSKPRKLADIRAQVFPSGASERALESLLALVSFGKEKDSGRVFAPIRSHLFFRGVQGIYACINPDCTAEGRRSKGIFGKIHATPKLACECGSRVYEVLTHRDCGASFIRGFIHNEVGDFLWHQPSKGICEGGGGLLEAHYLLEIDRRALSSLGGQEGSSIWLHKSTGRLVYERPSLDQLSNFTELLRPDGQILVSGQRILSFDRECPVCARTWQQRRTKIMDLATKGEAPFAQLIRTQVELQPQRFAPNDQSPNGGRKSLLFSDGRQKAARLARDIPREIESDVFRQLTLLGAKELETIDKEPTLSRLYQAVVHVLAKNSLTLFDGVSQKDLIKDVNDHRKNYDCDLEAELEQHRKPPEGFSAHLLRQLGADYYSFNALILAHLVPSRRALKKIKDDLPDVRGDNLDRIIKTWIQAAAGRYAIDASLPRGVRIKAAGHLLSDEGVLADGGIKRSHVEFLTQKIPDLPRIFEVFSNRLCRESSRSGVGGVFLDPEKLAIRLVGREDTWYQCQHCSIVSPVEWWGHCPSCLAPGVSPVKPRETDYLRARKAFFRDPVADVLDGRARPFNLSVEEHTAQLSYLDSGEATTTTEDFERRFRDILVSPDDRSIDVLSCTTTMEVGIDIGSLVGVGLRNIPPMRQNYQQRAGRTGRRGSAISTVVTFAQNSPHDSHYFENPEPIIAGEPTLPGIDTRNPVIIERHIRAQLIQAFFHSRGVIPRGSNIFSVLGNTLDFYGGPGDFSLLAFSEWVNGRDHFPVQGVYESIQGWLPSTYKKEPAKVATEFLQGLSAVRPRGSDDLDESQRNLIDFLFAHGFLPAYAFPRDICALQIEGPIDRLGPYPKVKILQRPQQGLSIALSEYAPGRFVVVDKRTYRIGTVAATGPSNVLDRARRLFAEPRLYIYCPACEYSAGFMREVPEKKRCPLCDSADLEGQAIITPEVVFPEGGEEVNEYSDDQVFTNATSAQLSVPDESTSLSWEKLGESSRYVFARNQKLVMVNKGDERNGQALGFRVCNQCGKVAQDAENTGPHRRDYKVTGPARTDQCNGQFEHVYLGYGFNSDALILRIPLGNEIRYDPVDPANRYPVADALQSLAEALVLGISRELDIDINEISAGSRFIRENNEHFGEIFVYDTLAGGAGYATQAGEHIGGVLKRADELLASCDCSSSCNKCLRHYGNRFEHPRLDRYLAKDLLDFMRHGVLPPKPTVDVQRATLNPLVEVLRMAGWHARCDSQDAPVVATSPEGRAIRLFSYPSLVRPEFYDPAVAGDAYAFSPYELSRDLPGVFRRLS